MVAWVGRNGVLVAAAVAFVLDLLLMYGFMRWWPGCGNFNTDPQRSGTIETARAVADRCPHVTAGGVQETIVMDTVLAVLCAMVVAGLLLLVCSSHHLRMRGRRAAAWLATAAITGAVLNLSVENGSLVWVTQEGWPPRSEGWTGTLPGVAGIADWTNNWALEALSVAASGVLLLCVGARPIRTPRGTR